MRLNLSDLADSSGEIDVSLDYIRISLALTDFAKSAADKERERLIKVVQAFGEGYHWRAPMLETLIAEMRADPNVSKKGDMT